MCLWNKTETPKVGGPQPLPEKTATPENVGDPRKVEDQALFGGTPDLRTDRTAATPAIASQGTGLKVM